MKHSVVFENPKWSPGSRQDPYIRVYAKDWEEAEELRELVEELESTWDKKAFIRSLFR